jgi:F0F1-type ATP synthase assembly protein I
MSNDRRQQRQERKQTRKELKAKILKKKELDEDKRDVEFEKGDLFAMFLALSYYLIPALLLILGVFWGIIWFIFLR